MSFLDLMESYFRGEKIEALYFIVPLGVALLVMAVVAFKAERGGYAWGVAIPCILLGAVLLVTGLTVGLRTNAQVAELRKSYEEAPAAMVKKELPRMEKVKDLFRTTFYAFGVLAVIGLALHYAIRAGWARGLGSVLVLAAGLGLMIDGFAERRAEPYTKALVELAEKHSATE